MARKATRNAQGGGTIRRRADGRWEARFTVGRDSGTGKQIQRSVYGATQKEVRQKLAAATAAIDEGVYMEPSKLTVGAWLDIWLAEYLGNVKPYTLCSYREQVKKNIAPYLGEVKLSALSAHTIQSHYNALLKGSPSRGPLSPKTIKNIHGILHSALNRAMVLGYIRFNPSDACTLPRVVRKEITPLDENDIDAFLNVIRGHQYEALFKIDLFTGMRQGEILALQWDCIDFQRGIIHINKQLQKDKNKGGGYYFAPLKNNKSRMITPAPSVMDMLQNHRRAQLAKRVRAGTLWDDGGFGDLVFTNDLGGHLSHKTVYRHFKELVMRAGIPNARFHDLRHSYAVASLQAGDDVKTVQENLGHHTAAFTLDVYGHVTDRMKQESAARMESFMKGLKNL